jgi:predicted ATPase/DNA-binding CsgD family transcriptional regulator
LTRVSVRPASLLVLDNAEHLLAGVADVVAAVGARASQVRVVTTSREPLGVPGEVVWRVPSLTAPSPERGPIALDVLGQFEAVQLFIDRARRARRGFVVTDDNAPAVAQICSRLDGVPLAIELAAARVRTMPPERIAAQLDDRFRLLSGGPRTALPRQQTLQASIAWSEELLDATERTVFARLGVFVGGFTVEAAGAVAGAFGDVDPYEVADVVARLADKSLLQVDEVHDRYALLETVRSYALQRLMERGETAACRDAHAKWFAGWLGDLAGSAKSTRSINEWWERRFAATASIDLDRANCLAALEWLPVGCHEGLRLVAGLGDYWVFRAGTEESARHGMPALAAGDRGDPAWLDAVIELRGVRSNALDDEYERLADEARTMAEHRQHRAGLLRLDGMKHMRSMWRDGPVDEFIEAMRAAHAGAVEARDWYVAWNTAQQAAQSLGTAGRIAEALALVDGLVHGRVSLIESAAAQFVGDYVRALERLRDCLHRSARGHAPTLDEVWIRFRLEAIVLDTGWSEVLDEVTAPSAVILDQLPVSYAVLRGAVDGLRYLREGHLERARDALALTELTLFGGVRGRSYLPRVDLALDDPVAARAHALELRARCKGVDAPYIDAIVDLVLAECAWPDDLEEALALAHQSLVRAAEHGLWPSAVDSLEAIGAMVIAGGRVRDGARLLAATQSGRDSMSYVYRFAHRARYVAEATTVAGDDEGWSEGAGLSLPEAVDLARRMRGERVRPTVGWGSLTPTELLVVEQVTAGLTNPQIAERLLMGRATVKTHLLHVFTKLGIGSRAELAAAAIRREHDTNHDVTNDNAR